MRYLTALPFPDSVTKEARDLVLLLLHPTPEKRGTIDDALSPSVPCGYRNGWSQNPKKRASDRDGSGDESQDMVTDEETFRFDEEEWNGTSDDLTVGSWEDQLANECKSF